MMTANTIRGANILRLNNNDDVINTIKVFSIVMPLLCISVIADAAINPAATAVMPLSDILIAFISLS